MSPLEELRTAYTAADRRDKDGLFLRLSGEKQHFGNPATVARLHKLWRRLSPAEMKLFVEENF